MELIDAGKEYWEIVRRVHQHGSRPLVVRAAISDLNALIAKTKNDAVRRRCFEFIARNQSYSPSNNGPSSGPRRA